jgi:hypothetical protein
MRVRFPRPPLQIDPPRALETMQDSSSWALVLRGVRCLLVTATKHPQSRETNAVPRGSKDPRTVCANGDTSSACCRTTPPTASGANTSTRSNWEKGYTNPKLRFWPGIIEFLGYHPNPGPNPSDLAQRIQWTRRGQASRSACLRNTSHRSARFVGRSRRYLRSASRDPSPAPTSHNISLRDVPGAQFIPRPSSA